jgi:hypothetical protein
LQQTSAVHHVGGDVTQLAVSGLARRPQPIKGLLFGQPVLRHHDADRGTDVTVALHRNLKVGDLLMGSVEFGQQPGMGESVQDVGDAPWIGLRPIARGLPTIDGRGSRVCGDGAPRPAGF